MTPWMRCCDAGTTAAAARVLLFIVCLAPTSVALAEDAKPQPLRIEVAKDDWGGADLDDVAAVLRSAGGELHQFFPGRKLDPIIVRPRGGPIVLFKRGSKGEYFVHLNTGGNLWAQYSYQFAHEMCHILCTYEQDDTGNKWFEESLCELASLFVLRRMSETWKTMPPYANWKDYAKSLTAYADQRIKESQRPAGQTLAQWYAANEKALRERPDNRALNTIVATTLLPLFEKEPAQWAAVTHLNDGKPTQRQTLAEFLRDWHQNVPKENKAFVAKLAMEFEIELK